MPMPMPQACRSHLRFADERQLMQGGHMLRVNAERRLQQPCRCVQVSHAPLQAAQRV